MHIAIVGAGIAGVTTAYELALDGHQVSVYEQRSAAAEDASFGSAGLLSPALLAPWAAPAADPAQQHGRRNARLRLAPGAGIAGRLWRWQYGRAARQPDAAARLAALHRLGQYSLARTRAIIDGLELQCDSAYGTLVLLRQRSDLSSLAPALQALQDAGLQLREVDADTARQIEPGLAADVPLAGALHVSDGQAANCRVFAQQLRQAAQERGVQFFFNTGVERIQLQPAGVQLVGGELRAADAVVVCAGMGAQPLLRPLGLRLPLVPVYGYTVSAPVREDCHAPQGSVIDPRHRIAMVRQGQRVRISGGGEVGRAHGAHHEATLQQLYLTVSGWFPGGVQTSSHQVQIWRGPRPTMVDGMPRIGATALPGLWLNLGHGASGWAQACASACLLADLVAGRSPEIDPTPFAPAR